MLFANAGPRASPMETDLVNLGKACESAFPTSHRGDSVEVHKPACPHPSEDSSRAHCELTAVHSAAGEVWEAALRTRQPRDPGVLEGGRSPQGPAETHDQRKDGRKGLRIPDHAYEAFTDFLRFQVGPQLHHLSGFVGARCSGERLPIYPRSPSTSHYTPERQWPY